jgi:hypothetical protein
MKKLITLVAAVTLLTGISLAQGATMPVEGSWGTSITNNGFDFDMTVKLEKQTMTTTNVCSFHGRSAVASVTVPALYDATTITVLASGRQDVNENGVNCNVEVRPDRMNYQVVGRTLILSHDGSPERFVLTRR